jgi:hypothetical protein
MVAEVVVQLMQVIMEKIIQDQVQLVMEETVLQQVFLQQQLFMVVEAVAVVDGIPPLALQELVEQVVVELVVMEKLQLVPEPQERSILVLVAEVVVAVVLVHSLAEMVDRE